MLGSVGLHVAVLASLVGPPISELPPPPTDDELVAFTVMGTEAMSPKPREIGPSLADAPAPAPAPAPAAEIADVPKPDPAPAPSPPAKPRETEPEHPPKATEDPPPPTAEPAPQIPDTSAPEEGEGNDGPPDTGEPDGHSAEPQGDHEGEGVGVANGRGIGVTNARGTGGPDARGGGTYDASSYGKEIVRLVEDELDLDPVPGIKRTDTIRVLLRVEPDGSLAWPASGRYGFALVLGNSLGPVRTRAFLKRIERASARFPPFPAGLKGRRSYDMELKFEFTRTLARG